MRMDFPVRHGKATSATRAPALPALHLQRVSNARFRKSESTSPPSFPLHVEKDVQLIGTRLLVFAHQSTSLLTYARHLQRQQRFILARRQTRYSRSPLLARYAAVFYGCV